MFLGQAFPCFIFPNKVTLSREDNHFHGADSHRGNQESKQIKGLNLRPGQEVVKPLR